MWKLHCLKGAGSKREVEYLQATVVLRKGGISINIPRGTIRGKPPLPLFTAPITYIIVQRAFLFLAEPRMCRVLRDLIVGV